jgi:hypothetical protein
MSNNFIIIQKFFQTINKNVNKDQNLLSIYRIKNQELKNILYYNANQILDIDFDLDKIKF